MNKEDIQELIDYNLEYMEAQQSEEIFDGDYTSAVDLKYANKQIEKLEKTLKKKCDAFDKAIEYIENHKLDFKQGTTTFGSERLSMEERKLLDILRGEDSE